MVGSEEHEVNRGFCYENPKERNRLEGLGVD
jgi:hypothetical protein